MSPTRDLLRRFRLSGTPGGAAIRGVPADRVAEVAVELDPILASLDSVQADATLICDRARAEAELRRAHADESAREVIESARRDAGAIRADAAARARRRADDESAAAFATAELEAATIRRAADHAIPAIVERTVAGLRRALVEGPEP